MQIVKYPDIFMILKLKSDIQALKSKNIG